MKKKLVIGIAIVMAIIAIIGYSFYSKIYRPNVSETTSIYIPTDTNFESLIQIVKPHVKRIDDFIWVAKKKNYPNKIRAGKFKILKDMNNEALVDHLRGGKQETVSVTFNNQDNFENLAQRISMQIEADSASLVNSFSNEAFLAKNGFDESTALAMYIPNTYDFYWATDAEEFREKMLVEYKKFWNETRVEQAKKQNITPLQVSTLASIVQKETAIVNERKTVAGLYLNRLHEFWPLQADPTIIYALKKKYGEDKEFKRVLNKDLKIDSPYNTYANFGLPPGPIGMPDISSINAVLNPEQHNYYYMCASVKQIGSHEFATTLSQHNKNAAAYQKWISQQGINR